jgi:hypothetical protein
MSQEFQAAANKADDLEDQMKAVNATVQAIDTEGKIETFGKALQGVTGAFSLAQGAAALFGSESEAVEKALLKVQAAIAIQQGVSGLIEGAKAARALALSLGLIGPAAQAGTLATRMLALSMNALPILAVLAGLTAVATAVALYNSKTEEAVKSTDALNASIDRLNERNEAFIDTLAQEALVNLELAKAQQGRTEDTKADIEARARIEQQAIQRKLTQVREGIAEEEAAYAKANEDIKKANEDGNTENAKVARENQQSAYDRLSAYLEQEEQLLDAARIAGKEARLEILKSQNAATQGTEKGTVAVKEQAAALRVLTDTMREFEQLQKQLESGQGIGPMAVINPTAEDAAPGVPLGPSPAVQAAVVEGQALAQAYSDDVDAYTEAQRAKIAVADEFADALGGLTQLLGEQTAAGKTFATAQALINTYLGVTQILANKTTLPEPAATIQKTLAVAGTLASGLAAVRRIQGFAEGGVVQQADGPRYTANRGDSVLISAAPGEVVLTRDQQLRLKALAGHRIFNDIGVPGFASGGLVRGTALANMPRTPSSGAVANAELSRAINSIDMSPVVRVTEIMDVMRSVQVAQSAASL